MLNSCSSDDSSDDGGNPDSTLLKSTTESYDGDVLTTTYTYSGNKLTGISYSDGDNEVYTYTGNLLTNIKEYYDGNLDVETVLEYDSSNRLISETLMFDFGSDIVNEFVHNADGTITMNENGGNSYIYTYNSDGNRMTEEHVNGDQDYTYTYDSMNNPFKNVHQREVFELIGHDTYKNNVLTCVNTGGASPDITDDYFSSYTYNSSSFPKTATQTYNAGTTNEEVFVTQLFY